MAKYIFKRLAMGLVSIFFLITLVFFLTRLMPGNPFDIENVSVSIQERIMSHYGLDQPVMTQYILYLKNILHGDLGISYKKIGTTVNAMIALKAPATLALGALAFLISLVLGILIGILAAVTKRGWVKNLLLGLTTLGISVPNYVLAILLMLGFGVALGWLPTMGLDTPRHYILPVVTLAVYPMAQISRLVKSSYFETMGQDYVVMARSKGLSAFRIRFVHILKNALIPVVTISGAMAAFLLTGSFVVENIFSIPGIGREFVNAVSGRDYTMIMGLTIFIGSLIVVCNLVADILCAVLDPRMKLDR